jgi:hypothetical protein
MSMSSLWKVAAIPIATMLAMASWRLETVRAALAVFYAAEIHPGDNGPLLTVFPIAGPKLTVPLPAGFPRTVTVNSFSPDGKAVYFQKADLSPNGIIKADFKPPRQELVPGTVGLGTIWNLTISQPSGRIFASGVSETKGQCGTFEIDPGTGTIKTLLTGPFPDCGGGGGAVSPDGTRALSYSRKELSIIDLATGTVQAIKGVPSRDSERDVTWPRRATWSPDGRWISTTVGDRMLLIDTNDTSKRRKLGSSGGPIVVWSPDSNYLLLSRSELRCTLTLYFDSLETVDVRTGKRNVIKSSHCEVGGGWLGWVASDVVSQ